MSEFKLMSEIIKRSQSDVWDQARIEWELYRVDFSDGEDNCLCGKQNIEELCYIQNHNSQEIVLVGNSCVNKFLGLSSNQLFDVIKRISKDIEKAPNAKLIEYAYEKEWITEWEHTFSLSTFRKRDLSGKQMPIRVKINNKILRHFKKR